MKIIKRVFIMFCFVLFLTACTDKYKDPQIELFFEYYPLNYDYSYTIQLDDEVDKYKSYNHVVIIESNYFCDSETNMIFEELVLISDNYKEFWPTILDDWGIDDSKIKMEIKGACNNVLITFIESYKSYNGDITNDTLFIGDEELIITEGYEYISEATVYSQVLNECSRYSTSYCYDASNLQSVISYLAERSGIPIKEYKSKFSSCRVKTTDNDPMTSCSLSNK